MLARLELLDEARVLGEEAPAGPHRVGAHRAQRREHALVVEIGRAACAPLADGRSAGPSESDSSASRTNGAVASGSV